MFMAKPIKSALIQRYGGIGDSMICTSLARIIKKVYNCKVDFAVRDTLAPLFENLDCFDNVFPIKRFQPGHVDTIKTRYGYAALASLKRKYDLDADMKNSIENNRSGNNFHLGPWANSVNSNYFHWLDMHLSWVNIDWTQIPDAWKRPIYKVTDEESKWAESILNDFKTRIGIQMVASSLARTYYAAHFLPPLLAKRFSAIVLFWDGNQWLIFTKEGRIGNLKCTLRQSAALVSKLNLFISADSGFSHIAEALAVPSISLYSTVPSWTRVKYYKHTIPLEVDIPCRPCFTLQRYCPARQKQAIDSLSKREKRILWAQKNRIPIQVIAQELNTTVEGISREFASIKERLESQSMIQAKCLNLISIDEILLTAENVLKGELKAFKIKKPINVYIEGTKITKIRKIQKILSNEKVEIRFLDLISEAEPSSHLLILTEDVIPP
ncbi:MAG: hypothetical protein DRO65_01720, partial [Candidatus Altiarchaeales archaeon]